MASCSSTHANIARRVRTARPHAPGCWHWWNRHSTGQRREPERGRRRRRRNAASSRRRSERWPRTAGGESATTRLLFLLHARASEDASQTDVALVAADLVHAAFRTMKAVHERPRTSER